MTTRDTVQGYFDRLSEKGEWEAFLSDELVFTSHSTPFKRVTGRDAFLESTKGFYSMIQALETRDFVVDGETACVVTRYELQPPGGRVFESHVAEVFEVREGRIESFDIYFDSAPFARP